MGKTVIYNNTECIVLRVWDNYFYDLQTKEKTERGIFEQYLSVPKNELCEGGQQPDTESKCNKHIVSNNEVAVCDNCNNGDGIPKGYQCAICGRTND